MAAGFKFRLETLEKLRKRERDDHRRRVGEAQAVVADLKARIERLSGDVAQSLELVRHAGTGGMIDLEFVRRMEDYRAGAQVDLTAANQKLAERETELDQSRAALVEASRRLKVIEKLRERQAQREAQRRTRVEQQAMDEAALNQFALRAREQTEGRYP